MLSAKLLGFSNFSILLPEAAATVGSVALLYQLVKRAFGVQAGVLAALMLALVPVSVIVGRSNIIDALPSRQPLIEHLAAGIAVGALLVAPLVWSGYSTMSTSLGMSPSAGPAVTTSSAFGARGGTGAPAGDGAQDSANSALVNYLAANQGSATYLVATADSQTAAPIILASGEPVMSLGGFSGSDPILTLDQFTALVQSGQVRYVLVNGSGGAGDGRGGGSGAIMSWVTANGTPVSGMSQLYDLSALQGAAG